MAKIKIDPSATINNGRIEGSIIQSNRSVKVLRGYSAQTNNHSMAQRAHRIDFQYTLSNYRTLSPQQKAQFFLSAPPGQTGFENYSSLNLNGREKNKPLITVQPPALGITESSPPQLYYLFFSFIASWLLTFETSNQDYLFKVYTTRPSHVDIENIDTPKLHLVYFGPTQSGQSFLLNISQPLFDRFGSFERPFFIVYKFEAIQISSGKSFSSIRRKGWVI